MNTPESGAPKIENKERKTFRILMAEDDPNLQFLASHILEKEGHEVEIVDNGKILLDKFLSGEKYDFIITDNDMPIMGGIEALRKIRSLKDETRKNIPVFVLTGGAKEEDIKTIGELGGIYLEKTGDYIDDLKKLSATIKRIMEEKK